MKINNVPDLKKLEFDVLIDCQNVRVDDVLLTKENGKICINDQNFELLVFNEKGLVRCVDLTEIKSFSCTVTDKDVICYD